MQRNGEKQQACNILQDELPSR